MRVIIAPDSFKGSLSAVAVAKAIELGIRRVWPHAEVDRVPIADGGEGTVDALVEATGGRTVGARVRGPMGATSDSFYGVLGDGVTAAIEMAAASGLTMVPEGQRNPLIATSFGTGELIRAALDAGFRRIIVGIGGSATNDGGAGMAQALGARLLDEQGTELAQGGAALAGLDSIDISGLDCRLRGAEVIVACDVTNPLTGPAGASHVYGPQKGATPQMVLELDAALEIYGRVLERDLGLQVSNLPGAGAAGGLGAGLMAFGRAKLLSGIGFVIDVVGLRERVQGASLVITGEGSMDAQTAYGKAPVGVAQVARAAGVPVVALAGNLGAGVDSVVEAGIDAYASTMAWPISLEVAMAAGAALVADAAERLARIIDVGRRMAATQGVTTE